MDKKEYEISYMLKSQNATAVLDSVLSEYGAEVSYRGPVREFRLAYPLKKERMAYFGFAHFLAVPAEVAKIKESLKLKSEVLRVLVVTPPVKKSERARRPGMREEVVKKTIVRNEDAAFSPVAPLAPVGSGGALTNEALEAKLEEILK